MRDLEAESARQKKILAADQGPLTDDKENAVRFAAGYVFFKLISKYRKNLKILTVFSLSSAWRHFLRRMSLTVLKDC